MLEISAKGRAVYPFVKRGLDILISFVLMIVLILPMLAIAIAIRVSTGERALFRQKRVGAHGRIFTCYKFRTMYERAPSECRTADFADAALYITPIGKKLRRTSLDELPQLFNVLCGQMSLVGPRPLIASETVAHELRAGSGASDIRPGITGLAQINGRDMLDDFNKVYYDTVYAYSQGLLLDVRILFGTLIKAALGEGMKNTSDTYS